MGLIGVTGATGQVGGRVARALTAAAVPHRLVVRDPSRAPDLPGADVRVASYADGEALRHAFDGVDVLLLVSASEDAGRVALHRTAVEAAAAAGVRRVVYTSFLGAAPDCTFTFGRDHAATEGLLAAARLETTVLRDSFYLDVLPEFVTDGALRGPAGSGRVGAVARADVAEVAVAALLDESHAGRTYDVTGPEALSVAEVAATITRVTGEPVDYVEETVEEAYASRSGYGAPAWEVDGWVSTYTAIGAGELDVVTDVVQRLTGHPPRTLEDVLRSR
ncbi:NAD(P)H-binding protein [Paenibacillus sp. TRM 82003]|uniref:NAD(P)H-binding protein n=1 Tax=Kineococcus sp. TRM81007 TaxID=2925831 RepID=UPI001F5AD9B1|nr:NAD(P)H-binding protein [Kineococcus sp. TRM81007]MCI2237596.1 NAD(P)H-binding protein [Kineococcus sp. TRM81007]MCI3921832.1 NAD(P)H-binding protein [Paenibacillus sp. TRM 82003]